MPSITKQKVTYENKTVLINTLSLPSNTKQTQTYENKPPDLFFAWCKVYRHWQRYADFIRDGQDKTFFAPYMEIVNKAAANTFFSKTFHFLTK